MRNQTNLLILNLRIMKKYLFLMLLPMVIGLASCDYHDKMIDLGELPTMSTQFIEDAFPGCKVVAVNKDRDLGSVTYDVVLDCDVRLEFDNKGRWQEVDCEPGRVPDVVVPSLILSFVEERYPNNFIEKIEHKRSHYTVELDIDIELVFDENGNLKRIDD